MVLRIACTAALALLLSNAAGAATRCEVVLQKLGNALADATCFESADLTTNNPNTTPANNSIPGLPVGAFTPQTDRATIAPAAADKTPITKVVPGIQISARIADDPTGQARFLLRLPNDWNGRLVVAGASGTRSEFNGDFAWSDYVVQQGYAYASQNKGVLNLLFSTVADPLGCRLNPASPSSTCTSTTTIPASRSPAGSTYMVKAAQLAQRRRQVRVRQEAAIHLRGRHVERRLPGAPRGRDRGQGVRRRGRLGRHVRR